MIRTVTKQSRYTTPEPILIDELLKIFRILSPISKIISFLDCWDVHMMVMKMNTLKMTATQSNLLVIHSTGTRRYVLIIQPMISAVNKTPSTRGLTQTLCLSHTKTRRWVTTLMLIITGMHESSESFMSMSYILAFIRNHFTNNGLTSSGSDGLDVICPSKLDGELGDCTALDFSMPRGLAPLAFWTLLWLSAVYTSFQHSHRAKQTNFLVHPSQSPECHLTRLPIGSTTTSTCK